MTLNKRLPSTPGPNKRLQLKIHSNPNPHSAVHLEKDVKVQWLKYLKSKTQNKIEETRPKSLRGRITQRLNQT